MSGFDLRNLPDDFIDNPHPHYAALRNAQPVYELPGGGLFLSRHADLMRVYKDRAVFSSDKKVEFYPKFGDSLLYEHHTTSLVFNDAPLHTRVRKAIAGALSPRAIAGMDVVVGQLVDRLLDDMAARQADDKPIDAVAKHATDCLNNHERLSIGLLVVPAKVGRGEAPLKLDPEAHGRGVSC